MKIRTAIFGVYVAASALGFAVLMAFILSEVRPRYVESMRHTLNDTAALLAVLVANDLAPDGAPGAVWRDRLAAVERAAGALRVDVTDARGLVVFDSNGGRDVGQDFTHRPELNPYFSGGRLGPDETGGADGELRVTAPVRRGDNVVGYVVVGRPLSSLAEAIWQARLRLITGSLALALVMTAAGWWIATKLTHSLERLTAHAQAVRDGKPSSPPVSRAREIAALAQAFEEMRAALEGKAYVERYTQALAHELKAPLSAIRGAAELLHEAMPAEDRARFLAHLRAESERIHRIVDRMLRLSALEARRGLESVEPLDLGEVAREAVEALRPAWLARAQDVRVEAAGAVPVRGERFLLVQAAVNLLQNAVEFTPVGGVITLRAMAAGGGAELVVEDAGPGVPDYATGQIFERFYSLPRPDTGRKSTGLGLSFVREIALLHAGEVSVTNRKGGGARAVLRLPAADQSIL